MSDTRLAGMMPPRQVAPTAGAHAAHAMTLFVMIVATLYFGKEVLMPVTLALLLAFVLAPTVNLLRRAHLGRVPSVLLGVTLGLCIVLAIGGVIGSQIGQLTTDIPKYAATVETKVSNVRNFTIGRLFELADKESEQKKLNRALYQRMGPRRHPRSQLRRTRRHLQPPRHPDHHHSNLPSAICPRCCRPSPHLGSSSSSQSLPCCRKRICGTA